MPETTPLIKAALNLRVGAGFDVYIVALVAIGFQITLKAIQEVRCIVSTSCRGVSVQKNGRQTIFPGAEQPHE